MSGGESGRAAPMLPVLEALVPPLIHHLNNRLGVSVGYLDLYCGEEHAGLVTRLRGDLEQTGVILKFVSQLVEPPPRGTGPLLAEVREARAVTQALLRNEDELIVLAPAAAWPPAAEVPAGLRYLLVPVLLSALRPRDREYPGSVYLEPVDGGVAVRSEKAPPAGDAPGPGADATAGLRAVAARLGWRVSRSGASYELAPGA